MTRTHLPALCGGSLIHVSLGRDVSMPMAGLERYSHCRVLTVHPTSTTTITRSARQPTLK